MEMERYGLISALLIETEKYYGRVTVLFDD